ncbi:MAG: hypothetical protein RRC07_03240 [Anaerolineae bacterium]|nr:hypothetical protein [Anaerolineae bacterium]
MNDQPETRLALLATLSELHHEPIAYDLQCLRDLLIELAPDLLCAEITREMWEGGDLSTAAVEVRDALAPVVASTDTVLVPVAPSAERFYDFAPDGGWRRSLVRTYERILRWGQYRAGRPEAVNGPLFEAFCHPLCVLTEMTWTAEKRAAWNAQNEQIAENVLHAVRRDPGRRILVAVQCQRIHRIEPLLKAGAEHVRLVTYSEL